MDLASYKTSFLASRPHPNPNPNPNPTSLAAVQKISVSTISKCSLPSSSGCVRVRSIAGARWRRVASCLHSLAGDGDTRGKAAVGASARAEGGADLAPDARGPIHGSGHDSVPLPRLAPAASDGDGDTRSMAAWRPSDRGWGGHPASIRSRVARRSAARSRSGQWRRGGGLTAWIRPGVARTGADWPR